MENELFEKTSVPKAYMTLALPVVMSMVVSLVYTMVDTYFIALTGNTSLVAGIALTTPVFTLMVAFGDIFGIGGSSLISRLFGEHNYEDAKRVSSFSLWASILFSLCVSLFLLVFRSPILKILGASSETWDYASDYYTWIAIGAVSIIFSLVPSNILRTEGLAKPAMIGSVIGSIVNIILDPIFIFSLGMGAAGAAIATILGNLVADCYYVYVILHKSQRLSMAPSFFRISGADCKWIFSIGIPASVTNMMQSLMITVTNHFLLPYGTECVAAMGIALKVNMISMLVLVGFAFGGQPLIGYSYGAKNEKRLKEAIRFAYLLEAGVALFFMVFMMGFAPVIIRAFLSEPSVVAYGTSMLRYLHLGVLLMSSVLVSTCICQSFGNALGALVLSISRQGIIYVLVILLFSRLFGYRGILLTTFTSDFLTAILAVSIIRRSMKSLCSSAEK